MNTNARTVQDKLAQAVELAQSATSPEPEAAEALERARDALGRGDLDSTEEHVTIALSILEGRS